MKGSAPLVSIECFLCQNLGNYTRQLKSSFYSGERVQGNKHAVYTNECTLFTVTFRMYSPARDACTLCGIPYYCFNMF